MDVGRPVNSCSEHSDHRRDLEAILRKLGYVTWLDGQLSAINGIIEDMDVFCTLPPGSGKSLIYQIAGLYKAMTRGTITFIITPLISLMKEQVLTLLEKGIYAVPLYSRIVPDNFYHEYKHQLMHSLLPPVFVFITPERLTCHGWDGLLDELYENKRIGLFVLDEAQVILDWGASFRPKYRQLQNMKTRFPDVPILALSGSMSPNMLMETQRFLGVQDCPVITRNPDRPNVSYRIVQMIGKSSRNIVIAKYIRSIFEKDIRQSGIVYCRTLRNCRALQKTLLEEGIEAVCYYSKKEMSEKDQSWSYQLWRHNFVRVMIATVAFGMGIDKENVRFIVHRDLPKDMSSYIQETGRAGRNGIPAECVLYYSYADCYRNYSMALSSNTYADLDHLSQTITSPSRDLLRMCEDHTTCRRAYILGHYGIIQDDPCNNCDVCNCLVQEDRLVTVRRKFVDVVLDEFRKLRNCSKDGEISIKMLADAAALKVPHTFLSLFTSGFVDRDYILDCDGDRNISFKDQKRICRHVIHNLILQGVFEEYPRPIRSQSFNFFLKPGNDKNASSGFTVLL